MPTTPTYPPTYSTLCEQYGLQQALIIPTTPNLVFPLNPDDIKFNQVDAGKSVSVKYDTFIRSISAFIPEINITVYSVTSADLKKLTDFATLDFVSNVRTTGKGSLTLYYRGEVLPDCYIRSPIDSPTSVWQRWPLPGGGVTTDPIEIFDQVSFNIISPNPRWF
jgi:hypothetical protein